MSSASPAEEGPPPAAANADNVAGHPVPAAPAPRPAAKPTRLTIFWDASGSRASTDHAPELALVRDVLVRLADVRVTVDLVVFRHRAAPARRFVVDHGDATLLLDALSGVVYDGGTNLEALSPLTGARVPDYYWVFSDGRSSFGTPPPLRLRAPVMVTTADPGPEASLLSQLALESGGLYAALTAGANDELAATLALRPPAPPKPAAARQAPMTAPAPDAAPEPPPEPPDDERLERLVARWQDLVEWWSTSFKYPQGAKLRDAVPKKRVTPVATEPRQPESESRAAAGETPAAAVATESDDGVPPWGKDAPYPRALEGAAKGDWLSVYLAEKQLYGAVPLFYFDCADFFYRKKQNDLGLQVLGNVAELAAGDVRRLRVLAWRLQQVKEPELATAVFEAISRLRPDEPQSWRDLALAAFSQRQYAQALALLSQVVLRPWPRPEGIELTALIELNAMLPRARAAGVSKLPLDLRLIKLLDFDVRVVVSSESDRLDFDLVVTEPSGERADHAHPRTSIGGRLLEDIVGGYGPEEYVLRRALPGTYTVEVGFPDEAQGRGPVTLRVDLFTNYGRFDEKRQSSTVRLSPATALVTIGTLTTNH